jgi:protein involved in polysaccharide export with SLBB domain
MNRYIFCIMFLAVGVLGNPMRVYANASAGATTGAIEGSSEEATLEYKIGKENVLLIDIYYSKGEKITQKSRVSAAGNITLPIAGEVPVAGLTVSQLQKKLHELLDRGEMVPPQVVVSVEEYSMVTLLGEVRKPGAYQIKGGVSVIDLIAQADGFNESAAPNEVKVLRTGPDGKKSETLVKVYDQMNRGAGEGKVFTWNRVMWLLCLAAW